MKELKIDLENCFGIGKMSFTFDFNQSNSYMIYAPNGTMKTSFARTLNLIANDEKKDMPKDLLDLAKVSKYELIVDGEKINSSNILVINGENESFDGSAHISSFLARPELKKEYESIHGELSELKSNLIQKLREASGSSDCEREILSTYSSIYGQDFYNIILNLSEKLQEEPIIYKFKYNDVFDSGKKVGEFIEKNKELLNNYILNYKSLLEKSILFKGSANTFGTGQAKELYKSIADNSFFEAGHTIVLADGKTKISNAHELETLIKTEIERILQDTNLKKSFEKVDNAIKNNELRLFKKALEKDNTLILKLENYEEFRCDIWINYLSFFKEQLDVLVKEYGIRKKRLLEIVSESHKDMNKWVEIVNTFNRRFYVPFIVEIGNKSDVILKSDIADLKFCYKNSETGAFIPQKKVELLKVLSRGEKRAFFILQFLFKIQARKENKDKTLLVLDDVADSFDYKNKFAIIEYINELHFSGNFKTIILTHNFDFYRTIESRLALSNFSYIAYRNNKREIQLKNGTFLNNVFKNFISKNNKNDLKTFISLIPFVRNLIEFTDNEKNKKQVLTSCLHIKPETNGILIKDVKDVIFSVLKKLEGKKFDVDENQSVKDAIIECANNIIIEKELDEILLENKLVLAIACRLVAEEYMLDNLPALSKKDQKNGNQTRVLFELYKQSFGDSDNIKILDKVNLMTPENIHLNSFMYEPLIDMSVRHLENLYKELIKLK